MSTNGKATKKERIATWFVIVLMTAVTIIGSASMIISAMMPNTNANKIANDKMQEAYDKAIKDSREQMEQMQKQREASLKALPGYENKVTKFDGAAIHDLVVETLQEGNGATVAPEDTITANYTGWLADGKIFDSTMSGGDLRAVDFSLQGVIPGWTKGLAGKRVGGVYLLSIPANLAYGSKGAPGIPANAPLKFIVSIVGVTHKNE